MWLSNKMNWTTTINLLKAYICVQIHNFVRNVMIYIIRTMDIASQKLIDYNKKDTPKAPNTKLLYATKRYDGSTKVCTNEMTYNMLNIWNELEFIPVEELMDKMSSRQLEIVIKNGNRADYLRVDDGEWLFNGTKIDPPPFGDINLLLGQ